MKSNYDVVIVGAGLVGAALALRLAQETKLSIAVFERAPRLIDNPNPNLRVVALGAVATQILDQCGVLADLGAAFCHPYHAMHVWDEFSNGELDFNAQEFGLDQLGQMVDSAQCSLLLQAALLNQHSIDTFFDTELSALELNRRGASFTLPENHDKQSAVAARLVLAADGPGSWVRQQAKIFVNHHRYEQRGIVARIETEKSHQDTAWQRFLEHGPLAILPVADNQSSIVWSANNARAEALLAMDQAHFEQALAEALDFELGSVSLLSQRLSFELRSQKAERYITHNLALVGDAAHTIHPLAGQGANLGFKDVQSLVALLAKTDKHAIGEVSILETYQRQRKADNEQTDMLMGVLHKAYGFQGGAWVTARGLGMNLISRSDGLKRALVESAIGG